MVINLMSFNTLHCENYKTKQIDFELMANIIKNCNADIVALNEIRGKGARADYQEQTEILASLLGFEYHYFAVAIHVDGKNPYGNALISRYPIKNAQTVAIPDPKIKIGKHSFESRCLLKAEVDIGEGINILVTHFGLNSSEQKNAVKTITQYASDCRCVLMGDFNVTPDNVILNPIKDFFCDTSKYFEEERFSFPSDNPKVKIDYIFTSPDLKVLNADIIQTVASDHCPHTAQIQI